MNKDTIGAWGMGVAAVMGVVALVAVILTWVRPPDRAKPEPVVDPGPQYTYNPWEAALIVCSDTNRDHMSGTWDPVCFLTIKELATRDPWGNGNRADKQTCRDIYAMVSDELSLKDKYKVVVCGR